MAVPQVLVLGCGMVAEALPRHISDYLRRKGIKAEVLDSVRATGFLCLVLMPISFQSQPTNFTLHPLLTIHRACFCINVM